MMLNGGVVINIILDIVLVSIVGGCLNYAQRILRGWRKSTARKDFMRSFVMSALAYLIFGFMFITGMSQTLMFSAMIFAITRKAIGEAYAAYAEYPEMVEIISENASHLNEKKDGGQGRVNRETDDLSARDKVAINMAGANVSVAPLYPVYKKWELPAKALAIATLVCSFIRLSCRATCARKTAENTRTGRLHA